MNSLLKTLKSSRESLDEKVKKAYDSYSIAFDLLLFHFYCIWFSNWNPLQERITNHHLLFPILCVSLAGEHTHTQNKVKIRIGKNGKEVSLYVS